MGWIALISLMAYVGFYAVGLGPVFWLVLSEIYPLRMRGRAMSVGTIANWGANQVVALTFLTLTQVLGRSSTFWLYAAISIGAWLFAFFLVPETKGKTLEEIEAHWQAGKKPRALGASAQKDIQGQHNCRRLGLFGHIKLDTQDHDESVRRDGSCHPCPGKPPSPLRQKLWKRSLLREPIGSPTEAPRSVKQQARQSTRTAATEPRSYSDHHKGEMCSRHRGS